MVIKQRKSKRKGKPTRETEHTYDVDTETVNWIVEHKAKQSVKSKPYSKIKTMEDLFQQFKAVPHDES